MSTPANQLPFSFDLPVVITEDGVQPQSPASLQQQLIAAVAAQQPGYTASLPGSLIEDMSSTAVGAIALCDQARVELVNSLTPFGANLVLLNQLAQVYGLTQGTPTNTSVQVVFTGTVGFVIVNGFLVGDGTSTYQVQGGGVIQSGGSSASLQAIAVSIGSFAVPANTVTQLATSVPSGITLAVNNPTTGTPGSPAGESFSSFRTRVLQAGLAASVGTPRYIKTLVGNVIGSNLVSVQQVVGGGIRVVVANVVDQFAIAFAIFMSIADVTELKGSAINSARNVTVSLADYPDSYAVLYVAAPVQVITLAVTWNTVLSSFSGGAAFPGLVQAPLAQYINSLGIGQVINVLELNEIFQQAVEPVLDASLLTRLVFTVSINSVVVAPGAGTYAVTGDPESYCSCALSGISVVQG